VLFYGTILSPKYQTCLQSAKKQFAVSYRFLFKIGGPKTRRTA
jgi:hypothetical protein